MPDAQEPEPQPEPPVTLTPRKPAAQPNAPVPPKANSGKLPPLRPQPKSADDVTARLATGQHLAGRPPRKRMTRRAWLGLTLVALGLCSAMCMQIHATVVLVGTGAFLFWNEWTGRGSDSWA